MIATRKGLTPEQRRFAVRYFMPFLTICFGLLTAGQLAVFSFGTDQLKKTSGAVTDTLTRVVEIRHSKGGGNRPVYGLVITLADGRSYPIINDEYRRRVSRALRPGDHVVIYQPTTLLKFLSAGFNYGVNQLDVNGRTIFSFSEVKKHSWLTAGIFAFMSLFCYAGRRHMKKLDEQVQRS